MVRWSIRAKERSSTARLFHRLAYTPLTAQPTDLGLTLRFTSPPSSSSSSTRHGPIGRSRLSVSAAKLSCRPAPSKFGTSSALALDRTLMSSMPGITSLILARIRSSAPGGNEAAMKPAWISSTRSARCLGESSPACSASMKESISCADVAVRRMLDEVAVGLQRHGEALRDQVVAALGARAARVADPAQHLAVGQEADVGRLGAVAGGEATGPAGSYRRQSRRRSAARSRAPTRSSTSGRSIRSASLAAMISSVVGSIRKSSLATTRCTGWSANGASRGWSGPASRSTAFGVLRSFDFRFTWEFVSCTARVSTPATTDRSSGSSSKTGMSVAREVVVVRREDPQVPPRLADVERQVLDRAEDLVERQHLDVECGQLVGHGRRGLLGPGGHEGEPGVRDGDLRPGPRRPPRPPAARGSRPADRTAARRPARSSRRGR